MNITQAQPLADALSKAIAVAYEANTNLQRVYTLKQLLDEQSADALDCDPEDRKAVAKLSELQTQLLIIPARLKKARAAIAEHRQTLLDQCEQFRHTLNSLASTEKEEKKAELAKMIGKYYFATATSAGDSFSPAERIAERADIMYWIDRSSTPKRTLPSRLHSDRDESDPQFDVEIRERLAELLDFAREQLSIFAEFKEYRTFARSGWNKRTVE